MTIALDAALGGPDEELAFLCVQSWSRGLRPTRHQLVEYRGVTALDVHLHCFDEQLLIGNPCWVFERPSALAGSPAPDFPTDERASDVDAVGELEPVVRGFASLASTALPIISFNAFNWDWRLIAADGFRLVRDGAQPTLPYDFSSVIPRTIDLQDALIETYLHAAGTRDSVPFIPIGSFSLPALLEHNDTGRVAQDPGRPIHSVAALWYLMASERSVCLAGRQYEIPPHVHDWLIGKTPRFATATNWLVQIREFGWSRDEVAAYGSAPRDKQRSYLLQVYDPYLAAIADAAGGYT